MPTIKGPKVIPKGNIAKYIAENMGGKPGVPFKATGWKSEFNSDLVEGGAPLSPGAPAAAAPAKKKVK